MAKTWQRCLVLVFFLYFDENLTRVMTLRSIYYLPIFLIPWLYESMHQCWSWLNRGFIFHLIFFNFQLPLLLVLKRGFISFFSSWIFSLTFNHLETYSPMRDVVFPSQPILNSWDMMIIIIMAKPESNVHMWICVLIVRLSLASIENLQCMSFWLGVNLGKWLVGKSVRIYTKVSSDRPAYDGWMEGE